MSKKLSQLTLITSLNPTDLLYVARNDNSYAIKYSDLVSVLSSITATDAIVAFAGGGQTDATVLVSNYNIIDTCATDLDSAKCDLAIRNKFKEIFNNSANDLNLFPAAGEKFIQDVTDLGTDTPTVIAAGNSLKIVCYSDGIWRFF